MKVGIVSDLHCNLRGLDLALEFLKRTRWELRTLRKVHVHRDRVQVYDVNGDFFEVRGVGYPDADVVALLRSVNTAFDPATIHEPTARDFKEFNTAVCANLGSKSEGSWKR